MGLLHSLVSHSLPLVPRPIVGRIAARYVAGEELESAIETVRGLNGQGLEATVAVLGEEVTMREEAISAVDETLHSLERIASEGLRSSISVKPTHLGVEIDETFGFDNLLRVVERAHGLGIEVTVDMEDHPWTDLTLRMVREAQTRFGNVGTVLQAYMRRTLDDIENNLPENEPRVRICKGIYIEPEEVAYQGFDEVRQNFLEAVDALFDKGVYTRIATHDRYLVDQVRERIRKRGLARDQYEFQTLLGVTETLRNELVAEGHLVRVYVPYGVDWYAYSIRRLRENPKIAIYVMKSMIGLEQ